MKMGCVGAIIQARMGSTRLPGKVLMKTGKNTILERIVAGLRMCSTLEEIILATTTLSEDDVLENLAGKMNMTCFRGDVSDVLGRFVGAAMHYDLSIVVRICADNPFLSPYYVDELVNTFRKYKPDYAAYELEDHTPAILTGIGLFGEVVSADALEKASAMTTDSTYREHVTPFIYRNPDIFNVRMTTIKSLNARVRLTCDTPEDLSILREVSELVGDDIGIHPLQLLSLIRCRPDLLGRMAKRARNDRKKAIFRETD